ncbi:vesicle transport protein SFT2B [Nilaparvata lugens]|uniref:vesicle transport protein SFT2B n=1 Tax=Nilaparvata lugens TaxID=108931 RepID=UPI000B98B412|nr:vesicle transport protein SFT2B [Nilaparvata lugens]
MDKLRRVLSGDDNADDDSTTGIIPDLSANSLSWSTRVKGFAVCFVLGIFISLLGSLSLFLHRGVAHFAFFYTIGNIVSMLSTCFLMGPVNQIKKMFAETRIIATVLMLVMLLLTLYAAIGLKNAGLTFIFLVLQWLAMTWYSLSYIPYARDLVKKTLNTCVV